ncbi:glycosyltransferase family 4 protein [Fictibacillus nanhaiensis]|uniref:glycosyltransferase family 4 protein n=1 Tax=Fictibacillus nanhaiensis TaxID=742169 RepID=UPI0020411DEB|nr:glycosyltransferase family 4 protein [Fictibacillus nanhaiensis]
MMKKLLVLNHFPTVYPPTSGGTLRYFHIYQELSSYYDITLLSQTFNHKGGIFNYSPTFREYKVEKDSFYNQVVQKLQHNELSYEFALIIQTELSKFPCLYKSLFETLYKSSDLIVHESPFLHRYDQHFGKDHKLRVYNSHNHEYKLAEQIWKNEQARHFLPVLFGMEKNLVNGADLVFSTSENERNSFITMYKPNPSKIKLAPNGIHPAAWLPRKKQSNEKPAAFFIGAEYPPNIESVDFIIQHLADRCPEINFVVGGGCCAPFANSSKPNVKLLGRVRHKQKLRLLAEVDFAINPMFTGAGVNLKTLEFLSAGIPLFSTDCGVRGVELIHMKHYIHAEKKDFADTLNRYHRNQSLLQEISLNGQSYINEKYSWSTIAKQMNGEIQKLIAD